MKFYIAEEGGSGMEFKNMSNFLDAITDTIETHEENGEEWFEIEIIHSSREVNDEVQNDKI